MTALDDLANVVDVATENRNRTKEQQRSLIEVALTIDIERGKITRWNTQMCRPRFVAQVMATHDGEPTAAQTKRIRTVYAEWVRCKTCDLPLGAHFADDRCPTDDPLFLASLQEAMNR